MLPYENTKQDYVTLSPHVLGALGRVLTDMLIFLIGYLFQQTGIFKYFFIEDKTDLAFYIK